MKKLLLMSLLLCASCASTQRVVNEVATDARISATDSITKSHQWQREDAARVVISRNDTQTIINVVRQSLGSVQAASVHKVDTARASHEQTRVEQREQGLLAMWRATPFRHKVFVLAFIAFICLLHFTLVRKNHV